MGEGSVRATTAFVASLLLMRGLAAGDSHAVESSCVRVADGAAPATRAAVPAGVSAIRVAALPLRLGHCVASDTPCGMASNAAVSLLRRSGIGGARDVCEFKKIERTSPGTCRVTQACRDLQDSGPPQTSIVTDTLSGDARFTASSESGWQHSARHCAQSSLPDAWRRNDLREAPG